MSNMDEEDAKVDADLDIENYSRIHDEGIRSVVLIGLINQLLGAITILSAEGFNQAPHQLKELLAIT